MADYIDAYQLAQRAFKRLFKVARSLTLTDQTTQPYAIRDLYNWRSVGKIDPVDEAFMLSFFEKHFKNYSLAVELFQTAQKSSEIYDDIRLAEVHRLDDFIKSLGDLATRKYFNFTPLLQVA
jgi:hypothetical protein